MLCSTATHSLFYQSFNTGAGEQDYYEHIPVILRELLYRLNDEDTSVLKATNKAFAALSKHVSAEELVKHIEFMRNLLASMVSDARRRKGGVGDGEFLLPGFNMPKGSFVARCRMWCNMKKICSLQSPDRSYIDHEGTTND